MKLQGEWTPVDSSKEDLQLATLVCRRLKCGSAVSTKKKYSEIKNVLGIPSQIQPGSSLREHISLRPWKSSSRLEIVCSGNNFSDSVVMVHFCNFFIILTANQENVIKTSDWPNSEWSASVFIDLLSQPVISISPPTDRVFTFYKFTVSCSIKPQYPGGIFELIFTTSNATRSYSQNAVNHAAHFLFPVASHDHEGNYSCVYHIYLFSSKFSSRSQSLSLSISGNVRGNCAVQFVMSRCHVTLH